MRDQLRELYGGGAAELLADALRTGRVTAFTERVWKCDASDTWGCDVLAKKEAVTRGLADLRLAGPTERSFALTPAFWPDCSTASALSDWVQGDLVLKLPTASASAVDETADSFEIGSPSVSCLQFELLQKLLDLGSYQPPKPKNKGGRPRGTRWYEWVAHLVDHFQTERFPEPADEELADAQKLDEFLEESANSILAAIDRRLTFKDGVKLDSRDTHPVVVRVLRHHLSKAGKLKT